MPLENERPPQTALGCLEDSHWDVARAALKLAEAVEAYFAAHPLALIFPSDVEDRMQSSLIRFRECAAQPI